MDRGELVQTLRVSHQAFIKRIAELTAAQFLSRPQPDKWSNGENLKHIVQSTRPLSQALILPRFILRMLFGRANRPSWSYDELVSRYQQKLADGGKASGLYIPGPVDITQRERLSRQLSQVITSLTGRLAGYSETDLDHLLLPHPLLGRLTLREMMYFTIYHVRHHQQAVEQNLAG